VLLHFTALEPEQWHKILVGAEPCIRDSTVPSPPSPQHAGQARRRKKGAKEDFGRDPIPTHNCQRCNRSAAGKIQGTERQTSKGFL